MSIEQVVMLITRNLTNDLSSFSSLRNSKKQRNFDFNFWCEASFAPEDDSDCFSLHQAGCSLLRKRRGTANMNKTKIVTPSEAITTARTGITPSPHFDFAFLTSVIFFQNSTRQELSSSSTSSSRRSAGSPPCPDSGACCWQRSC